MTTPYNVRDFGAGAIAQPAEELTLTNLRYKWLRFQPGSKATIYQPAPGAVSDSVGIQRAIDAAHAAGGGTVVIPPGDYSISPIELKSRVHLHLESGARLWGSTALKDFAMSDELRARMTSSPRFQTLPDGVQSRKKPLIFACGATDVSLTGNGQISGQSPCWTIPWMNAIPQSWNSLQRPGNVLHFNECRNLKIEGVLVKDSSMWSVVILGCDGVAIRGLRIHAFDIINCDGIDLVDSSNVTISDCHIHVTDDGICLKNHFPDRTMRNITVTNCVIRTMCNGIKIGTETLGNFEDITISNIVVHNPDEDLKAADGGINICAVDGGLVSNVNVSNLVTRNVHCAFYFVASARERFQKGVRERRPGTMERIFISNVFSDGTHFTPFVVGTEAQPIRHVHLSNIHIRKTAEFCSAPSEKPVPSCGDQYPNPFMFASPDGGMQGIGDGLPSYGLYLRHVDQIGVRDFLVECTESDARPFLVQEECTRVTMDNVKPI